MREDEVKSSNQNEGKSKLKYLTLQTGSQHQRLKATLPKKVVKHSSNAANLNSKESDDNSTSRFDYPVFDFLSGITTVSKKLITASEKISFLSPATM
jgi:hypothetical protein